MDWISFNFKKILKFKNLINYGIRSCFRTVNLIDTYDNRKFQLKCFSQNEFCLRHSTFKCINNKYNTIYHLKNTFYFSTEIGMSRSVNDIDLCIFINNCSVFGKNGNPSFPFNIAAVHDSFLYLLIGTEDTALSEQLIHQCGFAVVNVRDDRDVAEIFLNHIRSLSN